MLRGISLVEVAHLEQTGQALADNLRGGVRIATGVLSDSNAGVLNCS